MHVSPSFNLSFVSAPGIPWTRHMRLFALIYYLAAIDLAAVAAIVYTVHPGDFAW